MPWDVGNRIDRDRLHRAIHTSRDALRPFRRSRTEMIRDYVGSWYSSNGARMLTYVNKLNTTASIYSMALAFNNPQVNIDSPNLELWPFCRKYEVNINRVISNMDLKTTLQAAVLDAFFLFGMVNVYMADAGEIQIEDNIWIDPGKVWASRISPDDAILDMAVKDVREMRFCGHKYRMPYWKLTERDDFEQKVVRHMAPTSKYGAEEGSDRAQEVANGLAVDDDELEPMVWVENIYLPRTRQLVTFAADNPDLPALKVSDGEPDCRGPYKFLGLGLVPDNIIPTTPAHHLKALHDLSNRLYRKLSAQASRQKNTFAFPPGSEDDAQRHKQAKDGEYWMARDPKSIAQINSAGVDGNTHAFFLAAQEIYNVQSGNERVVGGLGADAETLGQEEIVQAHASGRIVQMRDRVNCWVAEIAREIGGLMFDDNYLEINSSMEAEHTGLYVDASWRPDRREGLKDHYSFAVEPNSMTYRPPEQKLARIMAYVQQVGTVWPLVQAGVLDIKELTELAAEYENLPDLKRIFKYMTPDMMNQPSSGANGATKPAVTSRETVRTNRSQGPSGEGMGAVLGQLMQGRGMGGGQQMPTGVGVG
jgi:hypothetical protein